MHKHWKLAQEPSELSLKQLIEQMRVYWSSFAQLEEMSSLKLLFKRKVDSVYQFIGLQSLNFKHNFK